MTSLSYPAFRKRLAISMAGWQSRQYTIAITRKQWASTLAILKEWKPTMYRNFTTESMPPDGVWVDNFHLILKEDDVSVKQGPHADSSA